MAMTTRALSLSAAAMVASLLVGCSSSEPKPEATAPAPVQATAVAEPATTTTATTASGTETAAANATPEATPTAQAPQWSYAGEQGPSHWATLNPEFSLCGPGKEQSPINLVWHRPRKKGGEIEFHYKTSAFTVIDDGHTIRADFAPGNYITLGGDRYDLEQVHFHSGSEHTIAGVSMPMELHLVHKNEKGEFAVLGVVLIQGPADGAIQLIWDSIPPHKNVAQKAAASLNPIDFIPKQRTHYSYVGSLTTPPCTEGVNWNVFNTPLTLSKAQILAFRKIYSANSRPVQPLNERQVVNY
jgi:carbonic anhydrase